MKARESGWVAKLLVTKRQKNRGLASRDEKNYKKKNSKEKKLRPTERGSITQRIKAIPGLTKKELRDNGGGNKKRTRRATVHLGETPACLKGNRVGKSRRKRGKKTQLGFRKKGPTIDVWGKKLPPLGCRGTKKRESAAKVYTRQLEKEKGGGERLQTGKSVDEWLSGGRVATANTTEKGVP